MDRYPAILTSGLVLLSLMEFGFWPPRATATELDQRDESHMLKKPSKNSLRSMDNYDYQALPLISREEALALESRSKKSSKVKPKSKSKKPSKKKPKSASKKKPSKKTKKASKKKQNKKKPSKKSKKKSTCRTALTPKNNPHCLGGSHGKCITNKGMICSSGCAFQGRRSPSCLMSCPAEANTLCSTECRTIKTCDDCIEYFKVKTGMTNTNKIKSGACSKGQYKFCNC